MTYFVVQFLLRTEKYQEDILDKRFEVGREIYNSLVNVTQKRYKEMIKTKNYRNLMSKLSGDKKKSLSQRWNNFNGIEVQRDLYSAFLIMNIASDLKSFDIDKCNERFDNFYRLHNLEVERLTGRKNLGSIAI